MAYSIAKLLIPSQIGGPDTHDRCCSSSNVWFNQKWDDFRGKIKFEAQEKRFITLALPHQGLLRPLGNFSQSLWGDFFDSFTLDPKVAEAYSREIQGLKKEVRNMLLDTTNDAAEKITLIDILERLGVSYHFEKEIQEELEKIFKANLDFEEKQWDLCTVALLFRIFRQRGFCIPSGVFKRFRDDNGKFDKSRFSDIKGLLSLYEAAYFRGSGETILEDAAAFTKDHLEKMVPNLKTFLQKQENHALEQTIRRGWPRTEARHNIAIYEEDETRNDKLVRFAKLDYNYLQMLHKQELCHIRTWWKNLKISKLSYPRDRVIEGYYGALGMYFEPQYSLARIMATKSPVMTSVIDDTFDSYGTIDELEVFTNAIQRWNVGEIQRLPDYMKIVYETPVQLYEEYEEELKKQGRVSAVESAREWWKELVRSYDKEAKWFSQGYMPGFNEYMENATITTTCFLLVPALLLGVDSAREKTFDFLKNPRIVKSMAMISRVIDDVATYEIEKGRGQVAAGIKCYMKEYGVSKEAFEKFHEMAEDAWKDLNEELLLNKSSIPMAVAMVSLNQARLMDVFYKHDQDGYTNPERVLKPQIISLLVDPVELQIPR